MTAPQEWGSLGDLLSGSIDFISFSTKLLCFFHFIPKAIAPAHNYNPIAFGKSFNASSIIFPPHPLVAEFISKNRISLWSRSSTAFGGKG